MSGYPYGNPQYPPPQGQMYPNLNPQGVPAPGYPAPGYPAPGQQGYGFAPYPQGQAGYPGIVPTAPLAPSYAYPSNAQPGYPSATQQNTYPGVNMQPGYPGVSPVFNSAIEWVPSTPQAAASLNDRAIVAGYEGHDNSPLWVIRARFQGDLIPGKLAIKHHTAYVPWGGKENPVNNFEVCCGRPEKVQWLHSRDGQIPPNAVIAGNTAEGEPLYVGRAREQRSLTPGKVHPSHKSLYISFGGEEIAHKAYEIMCTI